MVETKSVGGLAKQAQEAKQKASICFSKGGGHGVEAKIFTNPLSAIFTNLLYSYL